MKQALTEGVSTHGREALLSAKASGLPRRRIIQLTLEDAGPMLWGGEAVLRDGQPVGELRSGFYGYSLGRAVGLGLVRNKAGVDAEFLQTGCWEIDIAGERFDARVHLKAAYDPETLKPKG